MSKRDLWRAINIQSAEKHELEKQLAIASKRLKKAAKEFRECEADTVGTPSEKHFRRLAEEMEKSLGG